MDNLQAKQMLKQVDCHGMPRGYNGGYSELYKYCLESIDKLEKIEQIIDDCDLEAWELLEKIKEVLNG